MALRPRDNVSRLSKKVQRLHKVRCFFLRQDCWKVVHCSGMVRKSGMGATP